MPIKVPRDLPAAEVLQQENIFALSHKRAIHQDIRPLKVVIVNLMPQKTNTELQLLRLLSQSPLQIEVSLLKMADHESKTTSIEHLEKFYLTFAEIRDQNWDALIITGAPVEQLPFTEVDYWQELTEIMAWSQKHCTSILHICWGAQAGLFYHYGVEKISYPEKLFGIFPQQVVENQPIFRGFDDLFYTPHSRYTGIDEIQLAQQPALKVLAASAELGPTIIASTDQKNIFLLGHFEYQTETLKDEYLRDQAKGLATALPQNYFTDDQVDGPIINRWRAHATLLFTNWLNQVYQDTPYDLAELSGDEQE